MIVRDQQTAAMKEAANLAFERKVMKQLSADQSPPMPPAELQEFVHRSIARARLNGIASEAGLAEYCALLMGISGPARAPLEPKWLRRILTDHTLDESAKILRIRTLAQSPEAPGGGAA